MSKIIEGLANKISSLFGKNEPQLEAIYQEYNLEKLVKELCEDIKLFASSKNIPVIVELENIPDIMYGAENIINYVLNKLLIYALNGLNSTEAGVVKLVINGHVFNEQAKICFEVKYTGKKIKEIHKGELDNIIEVLSTQESKLRIKKHDNQTIVLEFDLVQQIIEKDIREKKNDLFENNQRNLDILIVDDSEINIKIFNNLLKDYKANIFSLYSGKECLKMLEDKKFDIVFLDHMMPELDGIETLKIHKNNENSINKNTPIIVLTANTDPGAKEEYLKEGFLGYLTKPVSREKLVRIIEENCL